MSVARQVTLWISRVVNTPDEMTCPPPWESEATQEAGKQLVALFSYPLDRLSEGWGTGSASWWFVPGRGQVGVSA
jgi:hypothetical protein